MRRSGVFDTPIFDVGASSWDKFPSKPFVDMLGRLFGVIFATIFESRAVNVAHTSNGPTDLQSLISELLHRLIPSDGSQGQKSTENTMPDAAQDVGKYEEEGVERAEKDVSELKRRLCENSRSSQEQSDRSVDLIRRSTSFFETSDCAYHLCPFAEKPVFEGLICFLRECCGGNPVDKGIMCATGNTYSSSSVVQPKNAVDFDTDSRFYSQGETNQWLCYDFTNMRIAPTHYIVRSNGNPTGNNHLRSWVIEGSEDQVQWVELDQRNNDGGLNGPKSICSYEVRTVMECRFIRLRATGPNWYGNNHVNLEAFEVFGGLRVPNSVKFVRS
jgi:hypothetical protein